jgi:hypothetical protein
MMTVLMVYLYAVLVYTIRGKGNDILIANDTRFIYTTYREKVPPLYVFCTMKR